MIFLQHHVEKSALEGSPPWSFRVKIGLIETSYKWSYNHYKWPYTSVTGVITLLIGVSTPFISSSGPPCTIQMIFGSRWTRPNCRFPSQYLKRPKLITTTTLMTFHYTGCLRGIMISWLIVGRISSPINYLHKTTRVAPFFIAQLCISKWHHG